MPHPRGRQPIGVNQPPSGGTNYPFAKPSYDIENLLGDFYMSLEGGRCAGEYPLHIAWMYGFGGTNVTPPAGWPTPTHDADIVVVDDDGNTVFDSTTFTTLKKSNWPAQDARLEILEWSGGDEDDYTVCRLTRHTAWTQEDTDSGIKREYDDYIVPENGELDSRTINLLPHRVTALRVGLTRMAGTPILLDSGFNVAWSEANAEDDINDFQIDPSDFVIEEDDLERPLRAGVRASKRIIIDAVPGNGLGVVPGCEETVPILRQLAGARADDSGNITIDMEGCLKIQRPVGITSVYPRKFQYLHGSLATEQAQAAIEIGNDCGPCCQCEYFVRTYKGLARQWGLWQDLATQSEGVRDVLDDNIARWLQEKDCRESNPLKTIAIAEGSCKVALGSLFCNTSKCCATPLIIRFTFQYFDGGEIVEPAAFVCGSADVSGSPQKGEGVPSPYGEEYTLAGEWPVFEALFDFANPQETSRVSFRVCLPDCKTGNGLRMWVSIHYPELEDPIDGTECDDIIAEVPQDLQDIWAGSELGDPVHTTRFYQSTRIIPLSNVSSYCNTCGCPVGTDESESA